MGRHRWRDSIKSYFGNYIDNEKTKEQEKNRSDVESKKMKIIDLIKEVENDNVVPLEKPERASEIVNHVEDIQQQYESLYLLYNNLTGELRRKAHYNEKGDGEYSSSSDSETDHYSKVKISEGHNGETESLKHQLENTNQELLDLNAEKVSLGMKVEEAEKIIEDLRRTTADLNEKLGYAEKEKEVLSAENSTAVIKIEEGQKTVDELQIRADQLKEENGTLKQELESANYKLATLISLNKVLGATQVENNALTSENSERLHEIEKAEATIQELEKDFKQLKETLANREDELSVQWKKYSDLETETSSERKDLEAKIADLREEINSLSTQKSEFEKKLKAKSDESDKLIEEISRFQLQETTLREQIDKLKHELNGSTDALQRATKNENNLQERLQVSETEKTEEAGKKRTKFGETEMLQKKQRDLLSEISRLKDENSNYEVTLRLLNRRLVVTEQSLNERELNHRQAETQFHKERNLLLQRITQVSEEAGIARRELRDTKECIAKSFNAFNDLEMAIQTSFVNQTSKESRILRFSEDLQNARKWVIEMKNENEKLNKFIEELREKKYQEDGLEKKVEEEKENKRLKSKVEELEKNVIEMKEITICREEEKREAIRQLCLWVDYRTENYDHLKQMLIKISSRD